MFVDGGRQLLADVSGDLQCCLLMAGDRGLQVVGVPADDRVGEQGEALGLEVLFVGSASLKSAEVGEEQVPAEGVE